MTIYHWTGGGDGTTWEDGGNWGGIPSAFPQTINDAAWIDLVGTYTINTNVILEVGEVRIGNNAVCTLNLNNHFYVKKGGTVTYPGHFFWDRSYATLNCSNHIFYVQISARIEGIFNGNDATIYFGTEIVDNTLPGVLGVAGLEVWSGTYNGGTGTHYYSSVMFISDNNFTWSSGTTYITHYTKDYYTSNFSVFWYESESHKPGVGTQILNYSGDRTLNNFGDFLGVFGNVIFTGTGTISVGLYSYIYLFKCNNLTVTGNTILNIDGTLCGENPEIDVLNKIIIDAGSSFITGNGILVADFIDTDYCLDLYGTFNSSSTNGCTIGSVRARNGSSFNIGDVTISKVNVNDSDKAIRFDSGSTLSQGVGKTLTMDSTTYQQYISFESTSIFCRNFEIASGTTVVFMDSTRAITIINDFTNNGTFSVSVDIYAPLGGAIYVRNNFINNGNFSCEAMNFYVVYAPLYTNTITNNGTITGLYTFIETVDFINTGTIDSLNGTIIMGGSFTNSGTVTFDSGMLSINNSFTNTGTFGIDVGGSGSVDFFSTGNVTSTTSDCFKDIIVGFQGDTTLKSDMTFYSFNVGAILNVDPGLTVWLSVYDSVISNYSYLGGTINMVGTSSNKIYLRSASTGSQAYFYMDIGSTFNFQYLDVKDNNASLGEEINAIGTNSTNSGNNVNWRFGYDATEMWFS